MILLRISDVARMLKISRSKAYQLVSQGKLPAYRIEGSIRVSEEDLRKSLVQARSVPPTAPVATRPSSRTGRSVQGLNPDRLLEAWREQGVD